jgi:endonuclease/exonuclease/phosphatase family metal-dependent hydrolase
MTYNVLWGGVGREKLIRDIVAAIRPDIAVFTEAIDSQSFNTIACAVGPHRADGCGRKEFPAVVSRWPIVESRRYGPPWARQKWIAATVRPFSGPAVTVHGIHLIAQPFWPFEICRRFEVGSLLKRLRQDRATHHVVAGDFNALTRGETQKSGKAPIWIRAQSWLQLGLNARWSLHRLTGDGYVDCYRACHPAEAGFTTPSWDPSVRIDYVYASAGLSTALRAAGTLEPGPTGESPRRSLAQLLGRAPVTSLGGYPSDHLPVWADFEWSGDPEGPAGAA